MQNHISSVIMFLGLLISIISAFVTWNNANFFLSKRDFYSKSKFELLKKKVSLTCSVFFTVFIFFLMLANYYKQQTGNGKIEIEKKQKYVEK